MNKIENEILKFYQLKKSNDDLSESNNRHEQMLKELAKAEHIEFIEILQNDVLQLINEYNNTPNQFKRRSLIRAIFAFIEGNLHALKQEILIAENYKRNMKLSSDEIIILNETAPYLDKKGKLKKSARYFEFSLNAIFIFNCYAKVSEFKSDLDVKSKEWECFKDSIKVRNRITHPRNKDDLEIDDNELVKAYISFMWFRKIVIELFEKKAIALKSRIPGQAIF